jgi:hypothetical protein
MSINLNLAGIEFKKSFTKIACDSSFEKTPNCWVKKG